MRLAATNGRLDFGLNSRIFGSGLVHFFLYDLDKFESEAVGAAAIFSVYAFQFKLLICLELDLFPCVFIGGDTCMVRKEASIIFSTWVLSLATTLAIVYVAPPIFPFSPKAAEAVPFRYASNTGWDYLSPREGWCDLEEMSVVITLNRTSNLLIMFTMFAEVRGDPDAHILLVAVVDSNWTLPIALYLIPNTKEDGATGAYPHNHELNQMPYSFNFVYQVSPGTHVIKIQWCLNSWKSYSRAIAYDRTLAVMAFPS